MCVHVFMCAYAYVCLYVYLDMHTHACLCACECVLCILHTHERNLRACEGALLSPGWVLSQGEMELV